MLEFQDQPDDAGFGDVVFREQRGVLERDHVSQHVVIYGTAYEDGMRREWA